MSTYSAKFEYPYDQIPLILQNSYKENEFYAVDEFESKKLKIILAKYGCRHCFHTLPGHLHANLFPFLWDKLKQCYRADMQNPVSVQLNLLEEAVVNHHAVSE
ncbi:MAG: hypothetical protein JXB24_04490 [Bacteroidales bacterium]|jgi:hypothetical protein|nr:hypothetical protein [Bacteroidales bacterium]